MRYYTETIPISLAEKLKEKGMIVDIDCDTFDEGTQYQRDEVWCNTTYAEVLDWMLNLGYDVEAYLSMTQRSKADGTTQRLYAWIINAPNQVNEATGMDADWHEAANTAIEKALELI